MRDALLVTGVMHMHCQGMQLNLFSVCLGRCTTEWIIQVFVT